MSARVKTSSNNAELNCAKRSKRTIASKKRKADAGDATCATEYDPIICNGCEATLYPDRMSSQDMLIAHVGQHHGKVAVQHAVLDSYGTLFRWTRRMLEHHGPYPCCLKVFGVIGKDLYFFCEFDRRIGKQQLAHNKIHGSCTAFIRYENIKRIQEGKYPARVEFCVSHKLHNGVDFPLVPKLPFQCVPSMRRQVAREGIAEFIAQAVLPAQSEWIVQPAVRMAQTRTPVSTNLKHFKSNRVQESEEDQKKMELLIKQSIERFMKDKRSERLSIEDDDVQIIGVYHRGASSAPCAGPQDNTPVQRLTGQAVPRAVWAGPTANVDPQHQPLAPVSSAPYRGQLREVARQQGRGGYVLSHPRTVLVRRGEFANANPLPQWLTQSSSQQPKVQGRATATVPGATACAAPYSGQPRGAPNQLGRCRYVAQPRTVVIRRAGSANVPQQLTQSSSQEPKVQGGAVETARHRPFPRLVDDAPVIVPERTQEELLACRERFLQWAAKVPWAHRNTRPNATSRNPPVAYFIRDPDATTPSPPNPIQKSGNRRVPVQQKLARAIPWAQQAAQMSAGHQMHVQGAESSSSVIGAAAPVYAQKEQCEQSAWHQMGQSPALSLSEFFYPSEDHHVPEAAAFEEVDLSAPSGATSWRQQPMWSSAVCANAQGAEVTGHRCGDSTPADPPSGHYEHYTQNQLDKSPALSLSEFFYTDEDPPAAAAPSGEVASALPAESCGDVATGSGPTSACH